MTIIKHLEWSLVQLQNGNIYTDIILSKEIEKNWDWRECHTSHVPGITIEAVFNLLHCDIIICSTGFHQVLRVPEETLGFLRSYDKTVYVLQSEQAVKKYNELYKQNYNVGILLHSTC